MYKYMYAHSSVLQRQCGDGGRERRGDEEDEGSADEGTRRQRDTTTHIDASFSYDAVSPAVEVSAVVLLKDYDCLPYCKELATQEPSPYPLLDENHVLCEDTISPLLQ